MVFLPLCLELCDFLNRLPTGLWVVGRLSPPPLYNCVFVYSPPYSHPIFVNWFGRMSFYHLLGEVEFQVGILASAS